MNVCAMSGMDGGRHKALHPTRHAPPQTHSPCWVISPYTGLVVQGGQVDTLRKRIFFSRVVTAIAEPCACAYAVSAYLIMRGRASERSLFVREEEQE